MKQVFEHVVHNLISCLSAGEALNLLTFKLAAFKPSGASTGQFLEDHLLPSSFIWQDTMSAKCFTPISNDCFQLLASFQVKVDFHKLLGEFCFG